MGASNDLALIVNFFSDVEDPVSLVDNKIVQVMQVVGIAISDECAGFAGVPGSPRSLAKVIVPVDRKPWWLALPGRNELPTITPALLIPLASDAPPPRFPRSSMAYRCDGKSANAVDAKDTISAKIEE